MGSFFKMLFASIFGVIIGLFLLIIIVMIFAASSSKDKHVEIEENSILHLKFDKPIVDRASKNPLQNINFMAMRSESKMGLNQILESIRKASTDKNIKGIYLEFADFQAGSATIEEIRNALVEFKKSNKFIISHSDGYSHKSFYLASVGKMYLTPEGDFQFTGLSAELMFFKGAFEKLGVEPQIIRHGKFKSAIEPFILDKMSNENRLQMQSIIGSIWKNLTSKISESRNIPVDSLNRYANDLVISDASEAFSHKFVDSTKYNDEVVAELKKLTNVKEKDKLKLVTVETYCEIESEESEKSENSKNKIAVIYAAGEIGMGKAKGESIGAESLSEEIRKARLDEGVKAIVLRVNSPGGSALASEIILREMILAKKVKPVIVSMGDVAASGGYYISCAADSIFASQNTITGSIGVFGLMFNGQKLLNEKFGITTDAVTTNTNSSVGTMFRKFTPTEEAFFQRSVEKVYETFISHVSKGRKIEKAMVDSIGQGRVWTGNLAKDIKLIDQFGGLQDAILAAVKKARVEKDYKIVEYPLAKGMFASFLEHVEEETKMSVIQETLGENYRYYEVLNNLLKINGIQARLFPEPCIN